MLEAGGIMKRQQEVVAVPRNRREQKESSLCMDLEMAKKRDHKILITEEAIRKVPRVGGSNV